MLPKGFPPALQKLVHEFSKLPSIGEKSAIRLAYHLTMKPKEVSLLLSEAIREAREKVVLCKFCFGLSENECCDICQAPQRDASLLCVVEKPSDVLSIERSGGYRGKYHVLHGLWSPLRGVSPEQTKLPQLFHRLGVAGNGISSNGREYPQEQNEPLPLIAEVILATGTTVEGDATALYIAQALQGGSIRVSRIAQGIPKGGDLEYADELTLTHAISGRRQVLANA